ncbi:hypothetical protein QQY66_27410 [Streptomyces sp. DG2A-72]|uniref:hypothetical protein n=1 Tax=Streptomyces sp. DG2A-72 TaxID=3051386 RepID=UPI00265C868C|nr:hypothetical protein [Streptomyces sp. DG2A-72]MDO0935216.1 hypothetical protein [Streptomyces sp. DG2A-72]
MTWARAEKATRIAVNSVVFRSSGQNLTTAGTYIEMTSRLLEPILLALGVLATHQTLPPRSTGRARGPSQLNSRSGDGSVEPSPSPRCLTCLTAGHPL